MINLYIFNETSKAAMYGIGTYLGELIHALKDSGITICLIQLKADTEGILMEERDGVRYWYMPALLLDNRMTGYDEQQDRYYRNIVYWLRLHIQNTKHLIFHLNFNYNRILAEELKKSFDCRILTVVHYSDWAILLIGNLTRLEKILVAKQPDDYTDRVQDSVDKDKLLYAGVDHVVCLSQYMRNVLCKYYQLDSGKISVVPNGLRDAAPRYVARRNLQKKWLFPVREKIILFAGRLDDIKGLEYLIMAFDNVLKAYPRCRLVIAGDGAVNIYLKASQNVCAKVTYCGLLDKEKLYELYHIADVGVVPSLYEPFGYVAVEMMMHSLPIIATATSGLNEVIDYTCGLKVPVIESPDKVEIDHTLLAEKIVYLLQHPKEAKKLGKNARKRYEQHYTSEIFGRNMINLYRSLFDDPIVPSA